MKLCKDCVHFHKGRVEDFCKDGPHIAISALSGGRYEPLPGARLYDPIDWKHSSRVAFDHNVIPCGPIGRHFKPKE